MHTMSVDDTGNIYANELNNLNDIVNSEFTSLNSCFKANKLTVNIHKTNFILFNLCSKHVNVENLKLPTDNNLVMQVSNVTFWVSILMSIYHRNIISTILYLSCPET